MFDTVANWMMFAFNHYQPPFDNVKLRRALLPAIVQVPVDAVVGEQRTLGKTGMGVPHPPRRTPARSASTH